MTQPCHKDTTLNQQCCDSEHKDVREEEGNTTFTTRPHTPQPTPHNTHRPPVLRTQHSNTATRRRSGQHDTRECDTRGTGQYEVPDLTRRQGTLLKRTGTTRDRGTAQHHTAPRHSTRPPCKRQGGRQHTDGDTDIQRVCQQHYRPSLTMPPTIRYATPPSTTAPPTTTTRGERTEDTPPHEHHRHTLTTHTPHTRQWNST